MYRTCRDLFAVWFACCGESWGEREPEVASPRRYVKYSNDYEARAIVDFEEGFLQVETIATENMRSKLRQAIVATVLTDRDMRVEDIFNATEPHTGGEPFLFGQLLDHDGQSIRWKWRAERFADHLLDNAVQRQRQHGRLVHSVRVALVDNHQRLRELEYAEEVLAAAQRYRLPPSLVYAVIEVESAFNPYAVSAAKRLRPHAGGAGYCGPGCIRAYKAPARRTDARTAVSS